MAGKKDKIKDNERFSIITPDLNSCYICGTSSGIEIHEVFYGTSNRKKSKEQGLTVALCKAHHTGPCGVHNNKQLDNMIKQQAEKIWIMKNNSDTEGFIKIFGRNYLDD